MTNSFTQVFGGTTIYPSDVSYLPLTLSSNVTLEWPLEASDGPYVAARIIDVSPTGIYTITMPDATKVGVGETVLFNNLGPDVVTVNTAGGNAILSISAGQQWQIYLTDNSTASGVWRTFRYGAATAQAQASALAGPGLKAEGSVLEQNLEVISFSSTPRAATNPDRAKVFVWTGALGTLTLPTAPSVGSGWFITVRNNGTGDLTVDPSGSETINGALTKVFQPGDSAEIVTDGVSWYTVGFGQSAVFAFDYTSIAITGGTYTLSGAELNRVAYKFSGALVSNATIIVPATIQQYWVNNSTTGAFTLSLQASGSPSPVVVPQGSANIYYCDGTNIVQAATTSGFGGVLGIAQGGTGAINAPGALTNLGGTGIGTAVFTAGSTSAARSAIAAAGSGSNSDITSLSGLTTPLSVPQGGTGSATASGARANLGAAESGTNSDITSLTNTAGIQIGTPVGGAQGNGTLNAAGLFINGVGVGTGSGSVTNVAMTVPPFLSVSGSPIITSGTLAVSLSGTALPVANGGTGQVSYSDGELLIGNSVGGTLNKATLTAGSGITITNGAGSITIASTTGGGTVTSVAVSGGSTGLTTSGGPITSSGTITLGGTLAITNGGTGAATASGARLNLDVPSTTGGNATGTWNISITGSAASVTSNATVNGVLVGYRSMPRSTTTTTATVGDVGKCIAIVNSITIPSGTFAAGDIVSIYNTGAGALTINEGAGLTLRLVASGNTGNRLIAQYGMANVWFNSPTEAVCYGDGVS